MLLGDDPLSQQIAADLNRGDAAMALRRLEPLLAAGHSTAAFNAAAVAAAVAGDAATAAWLAEESYRRAPQAEAAINRLVLALAARGAEAAALWTGKVPLDAVPAALDFLLAQLAEAADWYFAEVWPRLGAMPHHAWLAPLAVAAGAVRQGCPLAVIRCLAEFDCLTYPTLPAKLADAGFAVLAWVDEPAARVAAPWLAGADERVLRTAWRLAPPRLWLSNNLPPPAEAVSEGGRWPVSVMFSATQLGLDFASDADRVAIVPVVRRFDYLFCPNWLAMASFRRLLAGEGGPVLIPGGYPRLDRLLPPQSAPVEVPAAPRRQVVYAPAHGYRSRGLELASLGWAEALIAALLAAGIAVTFRPHPLSLTRYPADRAIVDQIAARFAGDPAFTFDTSRDAAPVYQASDLLLTDYSGTCYTYQAVYRRPVVFCLAQAPADYAAAGLDFSFTEAGLVALEPVAAVAAVERLYADWPAALAAVRSASAAANFHLGSSEAYFIGCLPALLDRGQLPAWGAGPA